MTSSSHDASFYHAARSELRPQQYNAPPQYMSEIPVTYYQPSAAPQYQAVPFTNPCHAYQNPHYSTQFQAPMNPYNTQNQHNRSNWNRGSSMRQQAYLPNQNSFAPVAVPSNDQYYPPMLSYKHGPNTYNQLYHDKHAQNMPIRPPPATYCCRKCNQPGHWIQHCSIPSRGSMQNYPTHAYPRQNLNERNMSSAKHANATATASFECSACQKNFDLESQHRAHLKTHVKCEAPDCEFEACKRIVVAHYQTTHGQYSGEGLKDIEIEGQTFTVLVGNSAEDIAAWRAERRKRWPSKALREIKIVETKSSVSSLHDTKEMEDGQIDDESTGPDTAGLDVQNVEQAVKSSDAGQKQKQPKLCRKFCKNQCRFGDSCRYSHNRAEFPCKSVELKRPCRKGDACPFSHEEGLGQINTDHNDIESMKRPRKKSKKDDMKGASNSIQKTPKSLLHKLLQKDMDRDCNKALQVIRFIVENDFFMEKGDAQDQGKATNAEES
uniref:Uncharacterized protein AlNc14C351G10908 n=1 Tax=Albugo laibachii Nc14 TaxID=890382 RepID=F0WXF8_9STRA|nr:conserved hypothetical protein [Albugo laibachii Nc14]|eukprot:CCA26150.1 conserved hypothetical protein [Albugo laibachii Nc14]